MLDGCLTILDGHPECYIAVPCLLLSVETFSFFGTAVKVKKKKT
jgi:hypothetical protein